ncbi:flagellar sensor histidine kinase [Candidatus Photodesmus blepharus]|uniref:histidine kinase n=1 Tax=Candidatus Photodesmus blepharonis TaxID=1179155 RepID=A0A084CP86_9GAMM|nr:ATP-binding protein [Candidatus Photodesmus blepharus]KEY91615.1 flagellar sensor histidine kinase [Candidatus Photodesmus blepharus]
MQPITLEKKRSYLDNLEEQVKRYKQVLDIMPAGLILLDTQGIVQEANPEAFKLLNVPLLGKKWFSIIQTAFAPKDDDGHEISLRNGRKVQLAISPSSTGQLIFITDLTETRLLQSRISDLQRLSSLGRMVASLAHQLRTPLASTILYASNLTISNLSPEIKQRFQSKLMDRLHDLEKQINDMLLFAKGAQNKIIETCTISDLITELTPMIETSLTNNQINYSQEVENGGVTLLGNINSIASAISNLVINAIQIAGKKSKINVFFRTINNELKISVQDNGPGIPENIQSKITEPFFTTRSQGTGLGLTVVQMVCTAHSGRLEIVSKLGDGACFTMYIPLQYSRSNTPDSIRVGK